MHKRILTTTLSLLLFFLSSNAQFSAKLNAGGYMTELANTTTLVVLTGEPKFDEAFQTAVTENWTASEYKFITEEQLMDSLPIEGFTILSLRYFQTFDKRHKAKTLALFRSGFTDPNLYLSNTISYASVDNKGLETSNHTLIYRLPHMVVQVQDAVNIVVDENLSAVNQKGMGNKMSHVINKRSKDLADKTLLVDLTYTMSKILSIDEFEDKYEGKILIVTKSEIKAAIERKDKQMCYLLSTFDGATKINSVVDCSTGKVLYAEYDIQDAVNEEELNRFTKEDIDELSVAVFGNYKKKKRK